LVGKPEGKRRLGRPRFRGGSNIKLNINQIYWTVLDWMIHVAQTGMDGVLFGHGVGTSSSVRFVEFIEELKTC
jgi:hypothetical protein